MSITENQDLEKDHSKDSFLDYMKSIKQGDASLREEFILANKHFILNIISRILNKSAIAESCEEFNIGLSAFNHSIDNFDINGKVDFYTYSEQIIKEWVYDYIENENAGNSSIFDNNDRDYLYRKYEDKEEISIFKRRLWEFGITLRDLFFLSPRDTESIRLSLRLATVVTGNKVLFDKLISEKSLPIEDLQDKNKFQKKFIEKNKEYIISLCLIIKSNLKILQSYLKNIEAGKEFTDNIGVILEPFKKEAIVMDFKGQLIVINIKSNNGRNIGKQIILDDEGVHDKGNGFLRYFIVGGGVVAAVAVLFILGNFISNKIWQDSKNTVNDVQVYNNSTPNENPSGEAGSSQPTSAQINNTGLNTEAPEISSPPAYTPALNTIPVSGAVSKITSPPKHTSKPRSSSPGRFAQNVTEPTPGHAPAAFPYNIGATPQKSSKANGVPCPVKLSVSSTNVNVGDYFTIVMNTDSGNNGTKLTVYENGQLILTSGLTDNTPDPQTKTIAVLAKHPGTFSYSCTLTNSYGSTSSKAVTVRMVE